MLRARWSRFPAGRLPLLLTAALALQACSSTSVVTPPPAATCSDGVKNGAETDVDCGGGCPACAEGKTCAAPTDCASLSCGGSGALKCLAPSCTDGVKNGTETGKDCGGPGSCPRCPDGQACGGNSDCASPSICSGGLCGAPSCSDGVQDGSETGVDCGGSCPVRCGAGGGCASGADCASGVCSGTPAKCQAPTCADGVKNGSESGVDCGGTSSCPRCAEGQACAGAGDCQSGLCGTGHLCVVGEGAPCAHDGDCSTGVCGADLTCAHDSCHDGKQDNGEAGVDCGGTSPCGACPGQACSGTGTGTCGHLYYCDSGTCSASGCHDGVKDNGESAIDCGGTSSCGGCAGASCTGTGHGTCASAFYCAKGTCGSDSCHDGAQDANESGVDCGGTSGCGGCAGAACGGTGQGSCASGLYCSGGFCGTDSCHDGAQDNGEAGVDCGGTSSCGGCSGASCGGTGRGNCASAFVCAGGQCGTDTCHDNAQDFGEAGVDCGGTSACGGCSGQACTGTGRGTCMGALVCAGGHCGTDRCHDGAQDFGESDVDCGGTSSCGGCSGAPCTGTGHGTCASAFYCAGGFCGTDSCHDGAQDNGESSVDCGGTSTCGVCSGDACTGTGQGNCVAGLVCALGHCSTDTCHDGAQDSGETGVDCGGSSACGGCSGDACTGTGQGSCAGGLFCAGGHCGTDSCHDGVQDVGESAVDCGGSSACGGCSGSACTGTGHGTCASAYYCASSLCGADSCHDGAQDNGETGVDCGGSSACGGCSGDACTGTGHGNCSGTLYCAGGHCGTDSCHDGVQDVGESGVDCGGTSSCGLCAGAACTGTGHGNCASAFYCAAGVCGSDSCHDGATDNGESAVDCGGTSSCGGCSGAACTGTGQGTCASAFYCASSVCGSDSCHDGVKDNGESDKDCGGNCSACGVGKACVTDNDCAPWLCSGNVCGLGAGDLADPNLSGTGWTWTPANTTATGTAGSRTLTVSQTVNYTAGRLIFIHQTQGSGAGLGELNRIATVGTGAPGALTLSNPLARTYTAGAQALETDSYLGFTLQAGGTLTVNPWNGSIGGILALVVDGAASIAGSIDLTGKGFRGPGAAACFPFGGNCPSQHGRYGESSQGASGYSSQNAGGNGVNNGAGGGGGTRGQDCAAGGGGSYGAAGGTGAGGTIGACIANDLHGGGLGGAVVGGQDLTASLYLGAAGGEGGPDEDGTWPGAGGSGGGAVIIFAQSINVTGSIKANGSPGSPGVNNTSGCSWPSGGSGMGNGGGGSGGAIRIITAGNATIGSGAVTASGGAGNAAGSCGAGYPGGSGGVGRVHVRAGGTLTGTSSPAAYTQ